MSVIITMKAAAMEMVTMAVVVVVAILIQISI